MKNNITKTTHSFPHKCSYLPMLLLVIFLFSFLAPKAPANSPPLRVQISSEPSTLDPVLVQDVLGFNILSNVNEGLVRLDEKGKLQNGLAESYTISKDRKTYRFRLKKNARWSDGVQITLDDFLFSLQRALNPKTLTRDVPFLFSIHGAKEFHAGKIVPLGIKKQGDLLEIQLAHPDSTFLSALTMPMAAPVRKDHLDQNAGTWKVSFPSTGPYLIKKHSPEKEILLEPNPFYHAEKSPNTTPALPILFKIIAEETTALNLWETNQLEVLASITPTEFGRLEKMDVLRSFPSSACFYFAFNVAKPPFQDRKFRQQLSESIQRSRLAELLPHSFEPTAGYIPQALEGASPMGKTPPKEKEKKEKLAPPTIFSLTYASSATGNLLMERAQFDLKLKLGWEIKLEPLEWKTYLSRLKTYAPSIFYGGLSAPFNDPMSHLRGFVSNDPDNHTGFKNQVYDALVVEISHLPSGKKRAQLIQKAENILTKEEIVVIPLLERKQSYAVSKKVKGFVVNPFGVMDLKNLHF